MVVITDNGKVSVSKPDVSGSPALEVTYGQDILEFDCEMDATYQYADAKGTAWDP